MVTADDGLAADSRRLRGHLAVRQAAETWRPSDQLPAGSELRLGPDDWWYHGADDGDLVLVVDRVREDLSRFYADRVWVEGTRMDADGVPAGPFQALVRVTALRREIPPTA